MANVGLNLVYLPQHQLLMCADCQKIIGANAYKEHGRSRHDAKITKEFRGEMDKWISSLEPPPLSTTEISALVPTFKTYIPELPVQDGWECLGCGKCKTSLQHAKACARKHDACGEVRETKVQFLVMEGNRRTYYAVELPKGNTVEESETQQDEDEFKFQRRVIVNLDLQVPNLSTTALLGNSVDRSSLYKDNRWLQRCRFISNLPPDFVSQKAALLEIPTPGVDDPVLVLLWR